jgi:ABC-type sugar transport system substrate-binding protein
MLFVIRYFTLLGCLLLPLSAAALSVVFINPGKSDEVYWQTAARAMEAAAKSLDIRFEVRFSERVPLRSLEIAREIASQPAAQRPDYVVFSNDYATGPEVLRLLDGAGIKTFLAFSGISSAAELSVSGKPRERYRGWIGSLEPRAQDAGYLTAKALIAQGRQRKAYGPDGKLHLIALAGDRSTPTSIRRNEGMLRAVAEARDVLLDQEVYAAWNRDKAANQSEWLFQRYPNARLVWSGNDLMAFGAMQSWEKRGGKPGTDAWFSGINTSTEAMQAVRSGRLTALAGGHFIAGAWALVLIYDYEHGRDFLDEGVELERPMFSLFSADDAERFMVRFGDLHFEGVDFRRFSKVFNPKLKRYDFSFLQLLR